LVIRLGAVLSRLPLLDPIPKGIVNALISVGLASLGLYFFFSAVPAASPELLRTLALIGTTLLLAYVVEAVWLVGRVERDDEFEEWLGFVTGAGIAGFLGVIFALLLAEHRIAGHSNFLDELGTAWSAVSLLILGGVLVLQPLLAHWLSDVVEPVEPPPGGGDRPSAAL
jgi:hypothetical protein